MQQGWSQQAYTHHDSRHRSSGRNRVFKGTSQEENTYMHEGVVAIIDRSLQPDGCTACRQCPKMSWLDRLRCAVQGCAKLAPS